VFLVRVVIIILFPASNLSISSTNTSTRKARADLLSQIILMTSRRQHGQCKIRNSRRAIGKTKPPQLKLSIYIICHSHITSTARDVALVADPNNMTRSAQSNWTLWRAANLASASTTVIDVLAARSWPLDWFVSESREPALSLHHTPLQCNCARAGAVAATLPTYVHNV
jgi:hypothetical protein